MNPYMVLGVKNGSSVEECKRAYRKLSRVYHPDNLKTGNGEKFDQIRRAMDMVENGMTGISFGVKRNQLRHVTLFRFCLDK